MNFFDFHSSLAIVLLLLHIKGLNRLLFSSVSNSLNLLAFLFECTAVFA